MSLLTKLGEKFKNIKDDTKKRITATILAGGIALSGLGMAGCNNTNSNTNSTGSSIQTPGGDNGDSTTPGNNGGNENSGNQNSGNQGPDYSKYSQILQNVLTDSYYTNLASIENSDTDSGKYRWSYNNPQCICIPYGFLEDEGFDIDKYKSKELKTKSCIYLIENDLYIELLAEIKSNTTFTTGETSYFANYLLKYNLTDQELKELTFLFKGLDAYRKEIYIQGPLFVQELSYLKNPEVVSVAHITESTIDLVETKCDEREYVDTSHYLTYLKRIDDETIETKHIFQTHRFDGNLTSASETMNTTYLYTLKFNVALDNHEYDNNFDVCTLTKPSALILKQENKDFAIENRVKIKLLSANNCNFKDIRKTEIDKVFSAE